MNNSKVIKKEINKLKLPLIEDKGLVGSTDIYNRSKVPQGYEGVKLAIPPGYITPSMIPSPIAAAASSLLSRRKRENLPFNYNESYTIMQNGKPKEYLLLVNMHFDNHPKMRTNPSHPPYYHSGVSVFEKKQELEELEEDEEEPEEEIKLNKPEPFKENILKTPLKEEDLTITDDDISKIILKNHQNKINIYKLSEIIDAYFSLVRKNS